MADNKIKSVVLQFDTKFNESGVESAKKSIAGVGKVSEDFLKRVNDNLAKVGAAIRNTSGKKFEIKGLNNEVKDLGQLEAALQKISKAIQETPDMFTPEQYAAGEKILALTDQYVNKLNQQASASEKANNTTGFLKGIQALTPALGQYGFALNQTVGLLLEYREAAARGEKSTSTLGQAFSLLKSKLGLVIVGLTAVAAGIKSAASVSDEFSDSLEGLTTRVTTYFKGFVRIYGEFVKNLADGKGILESFKQLANAQLVDEKALQTLIDLNNEIEDLEINSIKRTAELNVKREEAREILSQELEVYSQIAKKQEALATVRKTDAEINAIELETAQKKLQAVNAKIQSQRLNQQDLSPELRTERANAEKEVLNIQARIAADERFANRLQKRLNAEAKAFVQPLKEFEKLYDEVYEKINTKDFFAVPKQATEDDLLKIGYDVVKFADDIKERFDELNKKELAFNVNTDPAFQKFNDILDKVDEVVNRITNPITTPQPLNRISQIRISPLDPTETVKKYAAENQKVIERSIADAKKAKDKADEEQQKALIRQRKEYTDQLFNELNEFIAIEQRKTDALIKEQERRVEASKEVAALGNAEQLQLEQERLNKLYDLQKTQQKRQAEIQALQKAADTGFAIAEFVAGAASLFKTNPVAAVIGVASLIASVIAGIAALRSASQGFEAGSDFVSEGVGHRGPTDTIPAWLAPGEMVIPRDVANKMRAEGMTIANLRETLNNGGASASRFMSMVQRDNKSFGAVSTQKMEKLLEENNRLLVRLENSYADQLVKIEYDDYGHIVRQKKLARQERKHKLIRR